MAPAFDPDWLPKPGTLDSGEHEAWLLLGGRPTPRQLWAMLRTHIKPIPRVIATTVTLSPASVAKLRGIRRSSLLSPFHFSHTFVGRASPPGGGQGRSPRKGRVWIYPTKREARAFRKDPTAKYNKRERCWSLPSDHPILSSDEGAVLTTNFARLQRHKSLNRRKAASNIRTAVQFQLYIEQAEPTRDAKGGIESDDRGTLSFGTFGTTLDERLKFWEHVIANATRANARIQNRIIAELPFWIDPADRRRIVERLGELFTEKGLEWWAAVHLPDTSRGTDPRNIHLHFVYFDRPVVGWMIDPLGSGTNGFQRGAPIFAETKNRHVQSKHWVSFLREEFAKIVNQQIIEHSARTGKSAKRWYFPGSLKDLGIQRAPTQHLGPRGVALARRGSLANAEFANALVAEFEPLGELANAIAELSRNAKPLIAYDDLIQKNVIHGVDPKYGRNFLAAQAEAVDCLEAAQRVLHDLEETALAGVDSAPTNFDSLDDKRISEIAERCRQIFGKNVLTVAPPLAIERTLTNLRRRAGEDSKLLSALSDWKQTAAEEMGAGSLELLSDQRKILFHMFENAPKEIIKGITRLRDSMNAVSRAYEKMTAERNRLPQWLLNRELLKSEPQLEVADSTPSPIHDNQPASTTRPIPLAPKRVPPPATSRIREPTRIAVDPKRLRYPLADYLLRIPEGDLNARATIETRLRNFKLEEVYISFVIGTRLMSHPTAGLQNPSKEAIRREQEALSRGLKRVDEELYQRNLTTDDLEKRYFVMRAPADPGPPLTATDPPKPASPPAAPQSTQKKHDGGGWER